jgi:hypothetical protein
MGIEPTSEAWEASILPLYDARSALHVSKGGAQGQEHSGQAVGEWAARFCAIC